MRASGKQTSSMEKVRNSGLMARLIPDSTKVVSRLAMATSCGTTATHIKATSKITISTAKEPTPGKTVASSTETGNTTKCMVLAFSRGPTADNTKAST